MKFIINFSSQFDFHLKDLLRGASVAFTLKVISAVLMFSLNVVLSRLLGAEGSGIFFLSFTIILIVAAMGQIGMENALVRFISASLVKNEFGKILGVYKKALKYSWFAALGCSIVTFFMAPWMSVEIFNKPSLETPLRIMALGIVPQALLTLHAHSLQGMKKIASFISVLSFWVPLITLLLSIFLVQEYGILGASISYLVAATITLAIGYFLWTKTIQSFHADVISFETSRLLNSSFPLFLVALSNMVIIWSPLIILGIWETSENVGIYNAANRTAMLTSFILVAVNGIAAPKFASLYQQGNIRSLEQVARNSAKIMTLLALPILVFFIVAPEFFLGFFGEQFKQGQTLLMILAVGQFINVVTGSVGYILIMTGNERIMRNNLIFCAFLGVALSVSLIPSYGAIGAAVGASVVLAVQNIIALVCVWRVLGIVTLPWARL